MTDTFFQNIPTPKSNDSVVSLPECADIEARLEAAVAANPHCPNNIFLRRRALVIPEGPSGWPEACVILRSSIWPQKPYGPVVGLIRSTGAAHDALFETCLFVVANMAEGFDGLSAFQNLHGELQKPTTTRVNLKTNDKKLFFFNEAVQTLCMGISAFTGLHTGNIGTVTQLEGIAHVD